MRPVVKRGPRVTFNRPLSRADHEDTEHGPGACEVPECECEEFGDQD